MNFGIDYKLRAIDLWWLTMRNMYKSLAGVCNVVFTVAAILLSVTYWNQVVFLIKIILVSLCFFFPIIQPLLIYFRVKKQISTLPKDIVLNFDEEAIHVITPTDRKEYRWENIKGITYTPHMVILNIKGREGFMLSYNLLKDNKEQLLRFLQK